MSISVKVSIYSLCLLFITSCAVSSKTLVTRRVTDSKSKNLSKDYQPLYQSNGGQVKDNVFNKNKAQRESEFMETIRVLGSHIEKPRTGGTTIVDKEIESAIIATNNKIIALQKRLLEIDLAGTDTQMEIILLLKEINDLRCKRIDAINQFLNKKVNKFFGDVSFKVGSSEISTSGKEQISTMMKGILGDIDQWKAYVSACNEKVFENELFIVVMDVAGYADQRGSESSNLKLSRDRAFAVRDEIIDQLNIISVDQNVSIVFDKIFADGFGEKLPPGVPQKGEDDPNRRICLISSVVGPSAILGN